MAFTIKTLSSSLTTKVRRPYTTATGTELPGSKHKNQFHESWNIERYSSSLRLALSRVYDMSILTVHIVTRRLLPREPN